MKVVIEVDPGELTPAMAGDMLAALNREIGRGADGLVRLQSPWASFEVTSVEVQ